MRQYVCKAEGRRDMGERAASPRTDPGPRRGCSGRPAGNYGYFGASHLQAEHESR